MSQIFDFLGCGGCIIIPVSTWSLVGMVREGFLVELGPKCLNRLMLSWLHLFTLLGLRSCELH